MAATDQTYRSQKILDIVFAVTCVLMLVSIIWMFFQDYNREFKHVQRKFRDVDEALTERQLLEKLPDVEQVKEASAQRAEAAAKLQQVKYDSQSTTRPLLAEKAQREADFQKIKAEYDSKMSLYNLAVENRDEGESERQPALQADVDRRKQEVDKLEKDLIAAQEKLDITNKKLKEAQVAQTEAQDALSKAEDQLKKVSGEFDRIAKAAAQKRWKLGDTIRNLPVLDAFAAPTRIQQYTLNDLPIDYSFKYVTRYDRCTTCHLALERSAFDRATLAKLTPNEELEGKLVEARNLLIERKKVKGEEFTFDPRDLPTRLRTVNLDQSQINEYCAHPRLDLFVEEKSPHPAEKFGCTICHGGQGSATDFVLASHTPNNAPQKAEWIKEHDWERNHYWDYPMLAKRFVESSCLKCHYQVTDLIRYGSKLEAPKLIRGYNLVRESGCFGCHEIAGIKSGREVGPDLRLEPSPPLEAYTPAERAKMLSDPLNPPGTMRKVGPSLYRISEKTNQAWARKWIQAPRNFRPSTKMPHFYGLSNNSPDTLPPEQKEFPNAEIAAITYYLFQESHDFLNVRIVNGQPKGQDKYRRALESRRDELQEKKRNHLASEQELRLLEELDRRLELDKPPTPIFPIDNPAGSRLVDWEGNLLAWPEPPKDDAARRKEIQNGRQLFTERGCLACHSHDATAKAEGGVPAVASEADFAPSLSRIAAKIAPERFDPKLGIEEAKRRWLIQWIFNPKVHHPRTRMPYTHLTPEEAADVAAWLLEQKVESWDQPDVPEPSSDALTELARVYLLKAPGMTRLDVDEILQKEGDARRGLSKERVQPLPLDADERELAGPLTDGKLKWYIARKAITRLGCYGCHEIPGFATAKPIGTPLNDWGKKDPERLAFEDIVAYVAEHYHSVEAMRDENGHGPSAEEGKPPHEQFYIDALHHHTREGFLHQKLSEPRSYDFNRLRTWDDRLRMPQFKFARSHIKPLEGETQEQAEAREEAEAREAVMTFILGLVAEPIPAKFVYDPVPDRLAEVKGRQILDKYNCAGCHQIRSGVYEIRKNDEETEAGRDLSRRLDEAAALAEGSNLSKADHRFPEHNAWTGRPSPYPDRLFVYGLPSPPPEEGIDLYIRLTEALRFSKTAGDHRKEFKDIPAGEFVPLSTKDLLARAEPFGGEFANLIVRSRYLTQRDAQSFPTQQNGESPESRKALPPPLLREGEKTQPGWLAQFLRNPTRIRPVTILRMPRFNMSEEEAMDLVNYFAAADKINNPGIGLTYPYLPPARQREQSFWHLESQAYLSRLQKDKLEAGRLENLRSLWDFFYDEQLAQAEAALKAAKDEEAKQTDKEKKKAAEDRRKDAEKIVAALRDKAAFEKTQQDLWTDQEAYAGDAYRLVANYKRCLNCHQVGPQVPTQSIGPSLELAPERLRADWTLRWIASPQRLLIYPDGLHAMPPNFKSNDPPWPEFAGSMLEQATAVRDFLINYPKVAGMPVNRYYRSTSGENK
jgi:mono/diheme cytochrome c family protein